MSIDINVFSSASSYTISATAATSNTALTQPTQATGSGNYTGQQGYTTLKIFNTSTTVTCYLQSGMVSQTATTSSPIVAPPNVWTTVSMAGPHTNLGAIMASSGTVTILVMLGNGA